MRIQRLWLLAALVGVLLSTESAFAQCEAKLSDINGTDYSRQTDVLRQLYVFDLARSTYSTSRSKSSFGVSYAGFGVNTSEDSHRRFSEAVNQSGYADLFLNRSSEIVRSYGDPTLLAGYLACLASNGGIQVMLQDSGPLEAVLRITYYQAAGGPTTAVISSVTDLANTPGVTVVTDGGCLRKGAMLKASNPCISTIRFDSATRPLLFAINTNAGGNTAFVPPRIRLVSESRSIPDVYIDAAGREVKFITTNSHNGDIVSSVGCTARLPKDFLISSDVKISASCHPNYPCTFVRGDLENQTPDRVCVRLHCGQASGIFVACTATVNGSMTALRWVSK